jgi:hypothetical protein
MAEGLRDRLIGAWRLAEFSVIARDGSVTHPMARTWRVSSSTAPTDICPVS